MRAAVYNKYDGRCAYCGKPLGKRWHIDHIDPLQRGRNDIGGTDTIDNMHPSCPRCNLWKKTFSVEEFRNEIAAQVKRLRRDSPAFRMAEDFGLITATDKGVIFYFESEES